MRILVIEDEPKLAASIVKGLQLAGFTADGVHSGEEGLEYASRGRYDAIVLDLMLPAMDGLSVVRELRARGFGSPVIALTCRATLDDRIAGLNGGFDDYMAKPFAFDELLARLRALLRRKGNSLAFIPDYAGLTIDPVRRHVTRDGRRIDLSNREYALLTLLLREPGRVFTRTAILETIWGYNFDNTSNVLEVYMRLLRKKIDEGFATRLLHTVRGVGYVLRAEQ